MNMKINRRQMLAALAAGSSNLTAQESGRIDPSLYIPESHRVEDRKFLHDFMDEYSFADLVTCTPTLRITHIPVILDRTMGAYGKIYGHISRQNPQSQAFDGSQVALLVFRGPYGYISPTWYSKADVVPTWNFAVVHASGRPSAVTDKSALHDLLAKLIDKDIKPRDIVGRDSIRNAMIVAMAIGGSTNVTLHGPEIARAAGFADFWKDIITPQEFNHLSQHVVPVLTDARPYGKYSMVDIDNVGGVQVIVRELLEAGLLNGDVLTCTGETLAAQVQRLGAKRADGQVVYSVEKPYKPTGGLRVLGGNLSPDFSAILKLAGVEGGLENDLFRGKARVFEGEQALLDALDKAPGSFQNHDMVIVRYEGPSGAPGMPEMLDPTSRITTLCRERNIVVALMTDARFSGGSVGLVIGHVGPEAALGGPIALIEEGDEIVVDLNTSELNCTALSDPAIRARRQAAWDKIVAGNGGIHPNCGAADTRLLHRARTTAVPATRGGGLHPNREVWVRDPRPAKRSGFKLRNKYRPDTNQTV